MVCTVKIGPFTSVPSANQIQVLDFCGQLKCFRKNKLNLLFCVFISSNWLVCTI